MEFHVSPKYLLAENFLMNQIETSSNLEGIENAFVAFAQQYTVVPKLWCLWLRYVFIISYIRFKFLLPQR